MDFLITLACTTAACFLLRNPVKRFPVLFYVLATALDVLFLVGCFGLLPWFAWSGLLVLMRRCLLAFSLFTVVMLVGVLPAGSKARAWLAPVRGELSLVACILAAGHVGFYVASYAPRMLAGGAVEPAIAASLALALVLLALLAVLGVTSLKSVRTRMASTPWKRLQRLAYPFYLLACAHVACSLLPAALHGGTAAQTSIVAYAAVAAAYLVLRLMRFAIDRRRARAAAQRAGI